MSSNTILLVDDEEGVLNALERLFGRTDIKVIKTTKGPQLLISRTHPNLVVKLFEFEIPEDYAAITLRINKDTDGKWENNPGHVVYQVKVKRR